MASKTVLAAIMLTLAATVASAQSPILLSSDDVYFQFRPASKHTQVGLCGFTIRGNHYSRQDRHVEWDLNIDELLSGKERIAGISAGTFDVVGKKRNRTGRAPIVEMVFDITGDPEPVAARLVGPPNQDNAVRAILETEPAGRLFAAFSEGKLITINLRYADSSADILQVRNWQNLQKTGPNSDLALCLKGYTPEIRNPRLVK